MAVNLGLDDRQSKKILLNMRKAGGYASDTEMIRAALRILRTLQEHVRNGFTDLIVQNPDTGDQLLIVGLDDVLRLNHGTHQEAGRTT